MSKKSRDRQSRTYTKEPATLTIGPRAFAAVLALVALGLFIFGWQQNRLGDRLMTLGDTPAANATVAPVVTAAAQGAQTEPKGAAAAQWGVTPEGDPFFGSPQAPVTVVEYADYQCPNCRQFATEVIPWLATTWLGTGFVRVVYRDFAIRGEASFRAAQAAHCAGEQGRYWPFHDALFKEQTNQVGEPFDRTQLISLADDAGLDPVALAACVDAERYRARVQASTDAALAKGFEGTPTYEINGRITSGAIEIDRWNELFQAYEMELGG